MKSILLSVTYLPLGSLSGPGIDHQRERELRGNTDSLWLGKERNEAGCKVIVFFFLFNIFTHNLD